MQRGITMWRGRITVDGFYWQLAAVAAADAFESRFVTRCDGQGT